MDAAAFFPLTAHLGGAGATSESDAGPGGRGGGDDEHLLMSHRREQEAVLERVETGAYFITTKNYVRCECEFCVFRFLGVCPTLSVVFGRLELARRKGWKGRREKRFAGSLCLVYRYRYACEYKVHIVGSACIRWSDTFVCLFVCLFVLLCSHGVPNTAVGLA